MDYKKIIDEYLKGKRTKDIIADNSISRTHLYRILKQNNIRSHMRRNEVDELFFNDIDTEEKAYCFGIWCSDGCVYYDSTRSNLNTVLYMKDLDVIEKIRQCMNISNKINVRKPKKDTHNTQYYIKIRSEKICQDLINKGCTPNKSLSIKFPKGIVPTHLFHHFVRGVFDGDGCISKSNSTARWYVSIAGTKDFLEGIRCEIDMELKIASLNNKVNNTFQLYVSKMKVKVDFLKWLYKDATIYMDRKYTKAVECIKDLEGRLNARLEQF